MSQTALFTLAPYVALAIAVLGWAWRCTRPRPALVSSPSAPPDSESTGSVSVGPRRRRLPLWPGNGWRLALLVVLLVHLTAFLVPQSVLSWNRHPVRLVVLEVTGFAFAGLALFGFLGGLYRAGRSHARRAPRHGDAVYATLLVVSITSGMATALIHRWGSAWGTATLVPYIESVLRLSPAAEPVARLPLLVRLHVLSSFALIAAIPFTREAERLVARRTAAS